MTFHQIETALRELTRSDWEHVAKSVVKDARREAARLDEVPNAEEEMRLYNEGYLEP